MNLLKLPESHQELNELKDILADKKFRTIIFAGLDINGDITIHCDGANTSQAFYDYCALLKFIDNKIMRAMDTELKD